MGDDQSGIKKKYVLYTWETYIFLYFVCYFVIRKKKGDYVTTPNCNNFTVNSR